MRKKYYATEIEDGKFLTWFCDRLNEFDLTCQDLATKIGMNKQSISNIVCKRYKPSKTVVIAFCWAFGMKDNPEEIWNLLKQEDWG